MESATNQYSELSVGVLCYLFVVLPVVLPGIFEYFAGILVFSSNILETNALRLRLQCVFNLFLFKIVCGIQSLYFSEFAF
jgi:hypothetical protein